MEIAPKQREAGLCMCRCHTGRSRLSLEHVSNRAVAFEPALKHSGKHQHVAVDIVEYLHESFVVMQTMQPPDILLKQTPRQCSFLSRGSLAIRFPARQPAPLQLTDAASSPSHP